MPPFVPGIVPGTNWVCPRDKPGDEGLPLCKIRRKPGFVPGFLRACPRDKPGELPGTNPGPSQEQPDKKIYVYVPFSCLSFFSNHQRARPLRARPQKRVTLMMLGFFATEAPIRSKHFRREELIQMEKHECFWQRSPTAKQLRNVGRREEKLQTLTLSPILGGSSLGGPLGARRFLDAFFCLQLKLFLLTPPPPPAEIIT